MLKKRVQLKAKFYCDGSCAHMTDENWMGMGIYLIQESRDKIETGLMSVTGPKGTHNEAEYLAIMSTLELILRVKAIASSIEIHSDSQLIINQINGKFRVTDDRLKIYHREITDLCQEVLQKHGSIPTFIWVPRDHPYQKEADALSNVANPYYKKKHDARKSKRLYSILGRDRYERLHRELEWGSV